MKIEPKSFDREVLAGLVERVTYQNAESGFCVVRVRVRGRRELVTLVGHAAAIAAGEWITATGNWVNDRTHGQQFKARFLKTSMPTSVDGIERYLASAMIRGIGPVYAKKLLHAFSEKVFDVIEAEPDRLREVNGIGPVRAGRIIAAWAEQKVVREIMVFLHSHGVGYGARGPHLQDLRRRRRTDYVGEPLSLADRLLQLRNGKLPWPWIDPDKAIPWIEQRTGLVFAESQRSAVVLALTWEFAGEMQKLSAGKFHAPQERRVARLRLWIILRQTREYGDAAHALALLRVCCERSRRRRAAKRG
jgi:ATP-dependent exoDNAse (exonuclease V) alpha subunit